jgi:excisionase family DNA binding protein
LANLEDALGPDRPVWSVKTERRPADDEDVLTVKEVAAVLKCSVWQVHKEIEAGKLTCFYIGASSKARRIRRADLRRYIETQTVAARH